MSVLKLFLYIWKTLFRNEEGLIFGVKQIWVRFRVQGLLATNRSKFDLYDANDPEKNLVKLNLVGNLIEEEAEYKQDIRKHNEAVDGSMFYGSNSKGERLVTTISRNPRGLTSVWLSLQLEGGDIYQLPTVDKLFVEPISGPESFVGSGLRFKCLRPMRKWRISYNGLLKKNNSENRDGKNEIVYVKFGLYWTASSSIHYLKDENVILEKFLAKQERDVDIFTLTKHLDCYVQTGCMIGSVQIEGCNEKEIFLWGGRKRNFDVCDETSPTTHTENFVYSKEGHFLHYGKIKFPKTKSELEYAYLMFSNGLGASTNSLKSILRKDNTKQINLKRDGHQMKFVIHPNDGRNTLWRSDASLGKVAVSFGGADVDDSDDAVCLSMEYIKQSQANQIPETSYNLQRSLSAEPSSNTILTTSLDDDICRSANVSGGKGSSLADLFVLSKFANKKFNVPKGIVVTTAAYEMITKTTNLESLACYLDMEALLIPLNKYHGMHRIN